MSNGTAPIKSAVSSPTSSTAALLRAGEARVYLGLSRSGWFRARSSNQLPAPVSVVGSGELWRRSDLDRWLSRLVARRPRRRSRDASRT